MSRPDPNIVGSANFEQGANLPARPERVEGRRHYGGASAPRLRSGRAVLFGIALAFAAPAAADSLLPPAEYANKQLPDPRQEARARDLMDEIRCLVCQGQSIADSDADMAGDMRSHIRRRIAAGENPDQIRGWLVERYGNWVTYDPPVEPLTWPLWFAPMVLLGAGVWLMRGQFKRRKRT